ncbi:DNA alkylation repair protein [Siminovitchia sediminis]|uniref:DNA alkylation repair protein n=1 Tax=Siminovitchia sediminis TaxID=1274353 RepID=A0ABW4KG55_9BACI
MSTRYRCPNCKTNRTRFNIVDQVVLSVKMDPDTGEIIERYDTPEDAGPLHIAYRGPDKRIQCGVCGLIEDEKTFEKYGEQ